ncbi:polyamine-modulated factor 1-like [Dermacentor albipictus]|uniref:polyamine-modulated factor 1-like n=1 Tax=Dermacentor albipictus TaxID=60249 RepID=UPI0031FC7BC9
MDGQYCKRTEKSLRAVDKASKDLCEKFRQRCLNTLELQKYGIEKSSLEKIINSFSGQLSSHISAECRSCFDDLRLDEKFRSLSYLIEEQEKYKGTPAWRPSGNPDEDIQDHLRPLYQRYLKDLTAKLKEREEETNALEAQVAKGNKELESICAEIDVLVAKTDKKLFLLLTETEEEEDAADEDADANEEEWVEV